MLKIKHVPEQLMDVTITPVLFVLMFTYLFGGALAGSTGAYLQYVLPGILVMSVVFTTVYSGVALNTDLRSEEHTSELSHANIPVSVFCFKKKTRTPHPPRTLY